MDLVNLPPVNPKSMGPVKSWSYSTLLSYEQCPFKVYLSRVAREPQAEPSVALTRGILIHEKLEQFLKGELPSLEVEADVPNAKYWEKQLQAFGKDANVPVLSEQQWAFDSFWKETDWFSKDTWVRIKPDMVTLTSDLTPLVVDFKTGKGYGAQTSHLRQLLLYAVGGLLRYPQAQEVQVEIWYLDKAHIVSRTHSRDAIESAQRVFHSEGTKLTREQVFLPNPSPKTCGWCPYRLTCSHSMADG